MERRQMAAGEGELTMVDRNNDNNKSIEKWQRKWQAQYSRCFTYPYSYLSNTNDDTSSTLLLLPLDKHNFKPTWISSAASTTVSLLPSSSVLSVSLRTTVLEEHYLSKVNFIWPQVSCMSGFPARGSLVVIACYIDSEDEKQKFALRFATVADVEDFIATVEDILSNNLPDQDEAPAADVTSAISSESDCIPPYRPDTSGMMSTLCAASVLKNLRNENLRDEDLQGSQRQFQDMEADSESNSAFPPRFTSLVSNCYAEPEQRNFADAPASGVEEPAFNAQIAKYMQDASFLDIVNKVNEVISELGCDFAI